MSVKGGKAKEGTVGGEKLWEVEEQQWLVNVMGLGVYNEELFKFTFLNYIDVIKLLWKCKFVSGLRRILRNRRRIIPAGDSYCYLSPLNSGGRYRVYCWCSFVFSLLPGTSFLLPERIKEKRTTISTTPCCTFSEFSVSKVGNVPLVRCFYT